MKVAIIHFWLVGMRGGEKVVEALLDIYPQADIFTHVIDESAISSKILGRVKDLTFISKLPFAKRLYQSYLPLMPLALEQLDLRGYDLVISSESGPAKGVLVDPDALHICYCHSPMRYVWDMYHDYRERAGWFKRLVMPVLMHYLRIWDVTSSMRVSHFVANSAYVSRRIRSFYNRSATVIYPPVNTQNFEISAEKENYYLMVGELVAYKRADLAIDVFSRSGKRLKVVGTGELYDECRAKAPPNIEFLGKVDSAELPALYGRARALVFPGTEDFGIVPVEALASGTPVIAFGKGGALETVVQGVTGIIFPEQSLASMDAAIAEFESGRYVFQPSTLRNYAAQFDEAVFKTVFAAFVVDKMAELNAVQQNRYMSEANEKNV
ncbi:MAG: glycosyltransferase involved in cell wall biosynthesis [Paracoccaceae bacterium]|jgi:glycosyltransferase involved in cell wall biosynthesis